MCHIHIQVGDTDIPYSDEGGDGLLRRPNEMRAVGGLHGNRYIYKS